MKLATITGVGNNLGLALPQDLVRSLGWVKGDKVALYVKGGDIVLRNSSARSIKFVRTFRERREQLDATAGG